MQIVKLAVGSILAGALLSACCLFPSKEPAGIDRDKVATEVTQLVRGMRWKTLTGTQACTPGQTVKQLTPLWVQVTVSMLEQGTTEINPSISAPVPIGIVTPTVGYDVKNQRGVQTDTVIIVQHLDESTTWPALSDEKRKKEADELTSLVEKAETDVVTGGDSAKPCLGVNNIAISTILDLVQTVNGEIKIGIGPLVAADLKANAAKESKATMKFEVHYAGSPPPVQDQLAQLIQEQVALKEQINLFQQQFQQLQQSLREQ